MTFVVNVQVTCNYLMFPVIKYNLISTTYMYIIGDVFKNKKGIKTINVYCIM